MGLVENVSIERSQLKSPNGHDVTKVAIIEVNIA